MSCGVGHGHGSDPMLLWLWCRPAATAPIQPLAWEPPYAAGAALKSKERKRKKGKRKQRKGKERKGGREKERNRSDLKRSVLLTQIYPVNDYHKLFISKARTLKNVSE